MNNGDDIIFNELIIKELNNIGESFYLNDVEFSYNGEKVVITILTNGIEGGSCWEDSNPKSFTNEYSELTILKLVSKILEENFNKTFSIKDIRENYRVEKGYYENRENYKILNFKLKDIS